MGSRNFISDVLIYRLRGITKLILVQMYLDATPLYQPSPNRDPAQCGYVIQSWHEVGNILTHPALVITSIDGTSRGEQFAIYDVNGNIAGYIERDKSQFSTRVIPGSPFALRLVDPYGRLLLTIYRPFSPSHPRLEVSGFDPGTGTNVMLGGSQEMFHLFKTRYGMFAGSDSNVQFGRVSVQSRYNSSPVENNAGAIVAFIDRHWQGVCDELSSRSDTYVIRMDRSTFSMAEQQDMHIGESLSLDQRAVLLATAIAVDVDYFPSRITLSDDEAEMAGMVAAYAAAIRSGAP